MNNNSMRDANKDLVATAQLLVAGILIGIASLSNPSGVGEILIWLFVGGLGFTGLANLLVPDDPDEDENEGDGECRAMPDYRSQARVSA